MSDNIEQVEIRTKALPKMKIKNIMTSKVFSVEPHVSIADASTLMKNKDIGSLPVVENNRLVGIITDRDIVTKAISQGKDPISTPVKQAMSSDIVTGSEETSLDEAVNLMSQHQIRRLPIVNNAYQVSGMVSLGEVSVRGSLESGGRALNKISQPH